MVAEGASVVLRVSVPELQLLRAKPKLGEAAQGRLLVLLGLRRLEEAIRSSADRLPHAAPWGAALEFA